MSRAEKEKIKTNLAGYRHFNTSLCHLLAAYGLMAIVGKTHIRVTRIDGFGGVVTLSKTPSDSRCGMNTALQIIRLIEAR